MTFLDDGAAYGDGNPNDTAGWKKLEVSHLLPADGRGIPYTLLVNRFESSSPDSEAFIHDPLGEILRVKDDVPGFGEVDEGWRVSTFVINHHRTLSVKHVHAVAVVSPEEQTIGLTIYKQKP